MIRRTIKHRRDRRDVRDTQPAVPADATPTLSNPDGEPDLQVSFDLPVVVAGLPGWTVKNGANTYTVASVTVTDGQHLTLHFTGNLADGVTVTIPQRDPGIRTERGGYVAAGTHLQVGP